MILLSIYRNEIRSNLSWHLGWIISLASIISLVISVYPGEEGLAAFMVLFEDDVYKAILGDVGGQSPSFSLWVGLMLPIFGFIIFIYALMSGVRVAAQSISDGTGELAHTLPVKRSIYLITRFAVAASAISLFFMLQFVLLTIPFFGEVIEVDKMITVTWWGILYGISAIALGTIAGLFAGNTTRGYQLSILVVMVLYVLQLMASFQPELSELNNFNPIALYQPFGVFLGIPLQEAVTFGFEYPIHPVYIILVCVIAIPIAFIEFSRKDLSDDAGVTLNIIKRINLKRRKEKSTGFYSILFVVINPINRLFSSVKRFFSPSRRRNNPFVFWARIFEKKFPFTADFIYSDLATIVISFLAVLMFFPMQLMLYPGDQLIQETLTGFASNPIMLVFTYGYPLTTEPYLWYVISQAIGIAWLILLPLSFFWVRKAIRSDGNTGTGEILGSVPIKPQTIVFQRFLAIVILLGLVILQMVAWLLISELVIGETYNQAWEVIAILASFPLYLFLISFSMILANLFKEKGGSLVGVFLIGVFLLFFVSLMSEPLNLWYVKGIFGFYDPVAIIQNASLTINNNGVLILSVLSIISTVGLLLTAKKFTWLNISEKARIPK